MRCVITLLLLAGLLGAASRSRHRYLDTDELEHLNVAYFISHGERLYDTVFENHPPLLALLLQPVARSCNDPVILIERGRLLIAVVAAAILLVSARCAQRLGGPTAAGLAAWLLLSQDAFLDKAFEIRPDVPAAMLLVVACLALGRAADTGRRRELLAGGAVLAIAVWFTPKVGYAALGAAVAAALARSPREVCRRLSWVAAGGLAVTMMVTLDLMRRGLLVGFWEDCVVTSARMTIPARWPRLLTTLARSVEHDGLTVVLGCCGLIQAVAASSGPRLARVLAGSALAGAAGLLHIEAPHVQNLLNVLPPLSILAALFLAGRLARGPAVVRAAAAVAVLLAAWPLDGWFLLKHDVARVTQLEVLQRVVRASAPGERVLDAWTGLYLTRLPAARHFYLNLDLINVLAPAALEHELDRALDRPEVRIVIRDRHFTRLPSAITARIEREFRPLRGCTPVLVRSATRAGHP